MCLHIVPAKWWHPHHRPDLCVCTLYRILTPRPATIVCAHPAAPRHYLVEHIAKTPRYVCFLFRFRVPLHAPRHYLVEHIAKTPPTCVFYFGFGFLSPLRFLLVWGAGKACSVDNMVAMQLGRALCVLLYILTMLGTGCVPGHSTTRLLVSSVFQTMNCTVFQDIVSSLFRLWLEGRIPAIYAQVARRAISRFESHTKTSCKACPSKYNDDYATSRNAHWSYSNCKTCDSGKVSTSDGSAGCSQCDAGRIPTFMNLVRSV